MLISVLCYINIILNHAEVRRVLKPGGVYLFIEHVAASGTSSSSFQLNLVITFLCEKGQANSTLDPF